MNKEIADELIEKLVSGRIKKADFEVILAAIEDRGQAIYIENSMKRQFLDALTSKIEKINSNAEGEGKR